MPKDATIIRAKYDEIVALVQQVQVRDYPYLKLKELLIFKYVYYNIAVNIFKNPKYVANNML